MTIITQDIVLTYPAVSVNNGCLKITVIPELGSNLIGIEELTGGIALLRTPETLEQFHQHTYRSGTPVLFPPNRLEDGELHFRDTVYQFHLNEPKYHNHIHGLVHDKPWTLKGIQETVGGAIIETEFDAANFADVLQQFPHRFILRMKIELDGWCVRTTMDVLNASDTVFPWGLGYHTTFNFPFATAGDLSRCRMVLTAKRRWELTDRLLPTGRLLDSADLSELRAGADLTGKPLDDVFLSEVVDGGGNECVLTDPAAKLTVTYRADDSFPHWVVFNADSYQGYVCPEPYTWVTNAPNLPLDANLTGVRSLDPQESARVVTEIVVQRH